MLGSETPSEKSRDCMRLRRDVTTLANQVRTGKAGALKNLELLANRLITELYGSDDYLPEEGLPSESRLVQ
jgi:hypothetical protein